MATRKKPTSKKAVVRRKKTNGAVAPWRAKLAALAKAESARAPATDSSNKISIKGKAFRFQDEELGDDMSVIILHYVYANNFYGRVYDEDNTTPPACAARSIERDALVPVSDSPDIQHAECNGCWANEFRSDDRGKGKACRNSILLAVVSSDAVTSKGVADTDVAFISVPSASIKNFSGYIKKVSGASGLPVLAFNTNIEFDARYDYPVLVFNLEEEVPEVCIESLLSLREGVEQDLLSPPDFSDWEPVQEKPKRGRKKKVSKRKFSA